MKIDIESEKGEAKQFGYPMGVEPARLLVDGVLVGWVKVTGMDLASYSSLVGPGEHGGQKMSGQLRFELEVYAEPGKR